MVCFLASDLGAIIRSVMRRFIKDDVLFEASTTEKLVKIDVEEKKNHKTYKQVDIGFSADKALKEMASNPASCREKFKRILTLLVSTRRVQEQDCDHILQQYGNFLDRIPVIGSDILTGFNPSTQRVDEFICAYLVDNAKLLDIVKLLLVFSHGQATVERGFLVSKEVELENLQEQSVVVQYCL
nr:PREDICTED: uncharacterized protein LOC106706179 [Latimeria chalumnae]|eukprot:XP_014352203.1 PREDICTED: uncharacterized protein LOC106706179 [Latimeria chalumnae]